MTELTKINPCKPFVNMARLADFEEMLVDSIARGFGLNQTGRMLIDEAVHHAYSKNEKVTMRDILNEAWELRERFGEPAAFEICSLMNCTIDSTYSEYRIFCERDGLALNELDRYQLKELYRTTSNQGARGFIERMIVYSLMF